MKVKLVEVEFLAGTGLNDAFIQAQSLMEELMEQDSVGTMNLAPAVVIQFKFNGVQCIVHPNSTYDVFENLYQQNFHALNSGADKGAVHAVLK